MFIESGFDGSFGTYSETPPSPPVATGVEEREPVWGIYRLHIDCGRSGDLTGVFSATDVQVENFIGKRFYASEALGKHSEVSGTFDPEEFTLVTQDPVAVEVFNKYNLDSGWTPWILLREDN